MKDTLTLRHNQKVVERDGNTYITGICRITEEPYTTGPINRRGLIDWLAGTPIQVALKGLPAEEREFLISGSSPEGWGSMFKLDTTEDDI